MRHLHKPTLRAALACGVLLSCGTGDEAEDSTFNLVADRIPGGTLLSVATVGDEAIFVGGQLDQGAGVIMRYDGSSLCYEENVTERALWWIHSARPGEFYAVGEAGTILHSVDGQRTIESVDTTSTLFGVWDSGDRVIAVGGDVFSSKEGEVWIRENGSWSLLADQLPGVTFKVWNNWIVGDGVAYHIEGGDNPELVPRFPPANAKLTTITGRSDDEVYAVGGTVKPVLLAWDGNAWQDTIVDPNCGNMALNGVWTDVGESVWVAGFFGTMGELGDDGTWNCATAPPSFETFHVVAKHGEEVLFAGGNFLEQGGNYGTISRHGPPREPLVPEPCD